MMRRPQQISRDICADPASDDLRFEYALAIEPKDPGRAAFIRERIRGAHQGGVVGLWERTEDRLLHEAPDWVMDAAENRGFIEWLDVDPFRFLARAESLFEQAPIQYVQLRPHCEWGTARPEHVPTVPSPVPELMASPHLLRLRGLTFMDSFTGSYELSVTDFEHVLRSPYLANIRWLDLPWVGELAWLNADEIWRRIYAEPQFRQMQRITIGALAAPCEEWEWVDRDVLYRVGGPMPALGRELEARYGYLPSLHLEEWDRFWDEGLNGLYYGELPRFPVGTPVSAATSAPPPEMRASAP